MSTKARVKYPEAIYHIMCRSASEFLLFRDDDDKTYYLNLLKRYVDKFKCSLYAYCLMDTHLHLHLDPKGFDVSKFMQCTNTAYVRFYNNKYSRKGHVFQRRFESRIVDTDEYTLAVSAYIHNNPHDIDGFFNKEENYKYSSYGIYLGIHEDKLNLIDKSFIISLFNTINIEKFTQKYYIFVSHQRDVGGFQELKKTLSSAIEYEYISGRKILIRDLSPVKVLSYISTRLMINEKAGLATKGKKKLNEFRAFSAYTLRVLCGLSYKEICDNFYNVTISGCSGLFSRGYDLLISGNTKYPNLFNDILNLNT